MDNLLSFIRSLTSFSNESWESLQPALSSRTFKKNEFILKQGEICTSLFYIDSGFCKTFYDLDSEIKNTGFFFENEIVTNVNSFSSGKESAFNIISCEPLTAFVFNKEKLIEASKQSVEIETLGRCCIRLYAMKQEELSSIFQRYTADERLLYMEKTNPQLLQRVSLSQLASFLGVKRETLSRIRKRRFL
ncbi:MAG: Crp/Fnr family transcriptional regulator [Sphingobacterium sp.]|jgi:CRP-like cAMP-binding protein|nr:Crp/Fnr family transcriptional regulator [Sphingobacterium sp.]